jgi:hypothetical protein
MKNPPHGLYHISSASSTHNQVLLRLSRGDYNYDILVEGVKRICLDFTFEVREIEIGAVCNEGYYEIYFDSESRRNMVVARKVLFQVNQYGGQESSIPVHLEGGMSMDKLHNLVQGNNAQEYESLKEYESWHRLFLS